MTYHRVCNKRNTTGATGGTGTAYPSGEHSRLLVGFVLFDRVVFCRLLVFLLFFFFWPLYCLSFFLLPFTASGIFKLFILHIILLVLSYNWQPQVQVSKVYFYLIRVSSINAILNQHQIIFILRYFFLSIQKCPK